MKVIVEVQHFEGCPHSGELIRRVREAVQGKGEIEYRESLIESAELARQVKFRGSPTLLINGEDFEGMQPVENASLCCRYYRNGLPETKAIEERLEKLIL